MCSDCGSRADEFDPKKGGHWQALTADVYTCHGCRLAQEALSSRTKDAPDLKGQKVRLQPTIYHPYSKVEPKGLGGQRQ